MAYRYLYFDSVLYREPGETGWYDGFLGGRPSIAGMVMPARELASDTGKRCSGTGGRRLLVV